ncbi:MAG: hypothetical protein JO127_18440 [Caulobacteraceae bacterium]|nr:hypothetical protein [Caulobacteraceae bacterium]
MRAFLLSMSVALAAGALPSLAAAQVINDTRIAESVAKKLKAERAEDLDARPQGRDANTRARNRQIGTLMADGRCDEARKMALQQGAFDLALKVKDLCTPAPGEPASPGR